MTVADAFKAGVLIPDARVLLCHVLNVNSAFLAAHPEHALTPAQQKFFNESLARRANGEPVAYIIGTQEFYSRRFAVTPATLIPRPETELLVEFALEKLKTPARVLDLGTGSGCIAVSIALERPHAQVVAVDTGAAALEVAKENANTLHAKNVTFLQSDWFAALKDERFDLIVSNPPYVADGDAHLKNLSYEPRSALVSGADGLSDIRRIVSAAPHYLNAGGWLAFEHGYDQGEQSRRFLQNAGFAEVFTRCDLAGLERMSGGRRL